jgi:signal peptidase
MTQRAAIDELMAIFRAADARVSGHPAAATEAPSPQAGRELGEGLHSDAHENLPSLHSHAPQEGEGRAAAGVRSDYAALIAEAEAIEAAWLATRDGRTPEAVGPLHATVLRSPDEAMQAEPTRSFFDFLPFSPRRSDDRRAAAMTPSQDAGASGPPTGRDRRWLRHAWNAFSWAGVLLAAVAMVAIAAVIVVPRAMGWEGMVVLSGSMEPELRVGGLAFMEPLSPDELDTVQPGDIITFKSEGLKNLISHRVVEVVPAEAGGLAFLTRGDANPAPDGAPIAAERVVGRVKYDVPYLGNLVNELRNRSTYYLFIGIPAALLIATELWSVVGEIRRYRREKSESANAEGAYS